MKALWIIELVMAGLLVVLFLIDMIILNTQCNAGFMGYPDVWSSEKWEKTHYVLATIIFALILICLALGILLSI